MFTMQNSRWLTAIEAAEYAKVSVRHFRAMVKAGRLPAPACLGRRKLYDRLAIDSALGAVPDQNPVDRMMAKIHAAKGAIAQVR